MQLNECMYYIRFIIILLLAFTPSDLHPQSPNIQAINIYIWENGGSNDRRYIIEAIQQKPHGLPVPR
jgi:hypothetical protein